MMPGKVALQLFEWLSKINVAKGTSPNHVKGAPCPVKHLGGNSIGPFLRLLPRFIIHRPCKFARSWAAAHLFCLSSCRLLNGVGKLVGVAHGHRARPVTAFVWLDDGEVHYPPPIFASRMKKIGDALEAKAAASGVAGFLFELAGVKLREFIEQSIRFDWHDLHAILRRCVEGDGKIGR